MPRTDARSGRANGLYVLTGGAFAALLVLGLLLYGMGRPSGGLSSSGSASGGEKADGLVVYCAAGIRLPVEQVAADYEREYGVPVHLQYGGSQTLLSQLEVARSGDLYIPGDDEYITLGREKGLVEETIPLATMRPVIIVRRGNPKQIRGIADLWREDVRPALGNPEQAAIGKLVRELLRNSGQWERLEQHVTRTGVFQPTVPEVANNVAIGSSDAGIVWDTTVALYPDLEAIEAPELKPGEAGISVGVLQSAGDPTAALRLARYLGARDKGLVTFREKGFRTVEGDKWSENPEITFFCGSVNRRAVEPAIQAFERREGVRVNTVYNGCGILTGQMRTIAGGQQGLGFPDTYMACDVYYLNAVEELFQDSVDISDTEVVIAVPKGNPKGIRNLHDLAQPGVRMAVGQPDQCTIGVLTRTLLQAEGVYDEVMANVVTQTATSALLVPTVTTGSVDATLAYATDTLSEAEKLEVIRIQSPAALAIQPFAIARSSEQKQLARRLYDTIAASRQTFETAGFHWRLDGGPSSVVRSPLPEVQPARVSRDEQQTTDNGQE